MSEHCIIDIAYAEGIFHVAIVPGHGKQDPGGTGPDAMGKVMRESKINLNVALELARLCRLEGWTVSISRTDDNTYLTPTQQLNFFNHSGAHVGVAIHHNDSANESAKGAEVLYQANSVRSKRMAELTMIGFKSLGQEDRGIKVGDPSKVAVMKSKIPMILPEYAFLTKADSKDVDELREQHAEAQKLFQMLKITRLEMGV